MSETPRTDAVSQACEIYGWSRQFDEIKAIARHLERELAAKSKECEAWKKVATSLYYGSTVGPAGQEYRDLLAKEDK
jgi:hypothetical protein